MRKLPLMLLTAAVALTACDDEFGPQDWDATPGTARLWSLDRVDYIGLPSAYDFVGQRRVTVEAPGEAANWDVVVAEPDGILSLLPAGALPDLTSTAGIAVVTDQSFEDLDRAPERSDAYNDSTAVPLVEGGVYVIRSRRFSYFGRSCHRYAKVHATEVDAAQGTLVFDYVRNPNCNDRSFVPPGGDD